MTGDINATSPLQMCAEFLVLCIDSKCILGLIENLIRQTSSIFKRATAKSGTPVTFWLSYGDFIK